MRHSLFQYRPTPTVIVAVTLAVGLILMRILPMPYLSLALCMGMVFLILAFSTVRAGAKVIWLNAAVAAFTMGAAELYFYNRLVESAALREIEFSDEQRAHADIVDLLGQDPVLGWTPHKGRSFVETTRFGNELLYRVKYSIDAHGLRIAPPFNGTVSGQPRCLLFFGDSFTFGEGVRDEETMPYRVGQKTHGRYQVLNFGFLGYGPHQMLAQLQHGMVESAVRCEPAYVIYMALPDHASRAAGLVAWDQFGPRYEMDKDGALIWKGRFAEERPGDLLGQFRYLHHHLPSDLKYILRKSALYKALLFMHRPVNDRDLERFAQIVTLSRRLVETRFPGVQFHVILWNFTSGNDPVEGQIIDRLNIQGIHAHLISQILPNYRDQWKSYRLHPADGHPNKYAHDLLADYVVAEILDKPGAHFTHD